MKEYAIYPFEEMRITQAHNEGNHLAHWYPFKNVADKPWDEACKDSGRSSFCPQNDYVIEEILGLGNNITNSVRIKTVNKVIIPYQDEPVYLELTFTHMEEEDLRKLYVGQILKKGSKPFREGMDGGATGNHFHCTANIGKYYGFKKNGNGKWCYVYEKSLLPDEAFYIDSNITTIYNARGYRFQEVPKQFLPARGWFTKGDSGENVDKINNWLAEHVKGQFFGDYTEACVRVFQKQNGLEEDGNIGPITLSKMEEQGFKE